MNKNEIILKKIENLEKTLKEFEMELNKLKQEYKEPFKIEIDYKTGKTIYK